jgi:hypothetical protein
MAREKSVDDRVGRPAKNPLDKVGRPVRCLVTKRVAQNLIQLAKSSGINLSDVLRLALYNLLKQRGMMTAEMETDPTWDELKKVGLL